MVSTLLPGVLSGHLLTICTPPSVSHHFLSPPTCASGITSQIDDLYPDPVSDSALREIQAKTYSVFRYHDNRDSAVGSHCTGTEKMVQ